MLGQYHAVNQMHPTNGGADQLEISNTFSRHIHVDFLSDCFLAGDRPVKECPSGQMIGQRSGASPRKAEWAKSKK